jgi:hypothetical protein
MLPDTIVEELTRPTPLQQRLVGLAWPSLSVESRLQLLAHSESGPWLLALALFDERDFVRYWAARSWPGDTHYELTASGTFSETKTETPEGRPASVCEIARNSDPLRGGSCACLCQLLPVPDGTFVCRCCCQAACGNLEGRLVDYQV